MKLRQALKLCLVTHITSQSIEEYQHFILQVVAGGVTCVQFRDKSHLFSKKLIFANTLQKILKPYNIPLIINDDVVLAKTINADGVHLGAQDMAPSEARKILSPDKIIGQSIESIEALDIANKNHEINYVSASAVFPSNTKQDGKKIWGLSRLKQLVKESQHPIVTIGGINHSNIASVMATGVIGVAVVSAIHDARNPKKMTEQLISEIQSGDK